MECIYSTKEYKKSRTAYMLQSMFEYFVTILVTDVYLATLLSHIGMRDSMIGIVSSFVSFAFLFQLLSIFIVKKLVNTKRTVVTFSCLAQMLFMSIYIVPFIPVSAAVKSILVIFAILTAYVSNYMVSGMLFKWANSFVGPNRRARFSANREIMSLVTGIVFMYVVGNVMDYYVGLDNVEGGFLFVSIVMLVLNIGNFGSLMLINKESASMTQEAREGTDASFTAVLRNVIGNKNFISVIIMTVLWYSARYVTIGFLGSFKTKDLLISVGTAQIFTIIGNVARIMISKPFGRFSDKKSYTIGLKMGLLLEMGAFVSVVFTTQKTWWLMIIYAVLYGMGMAGTNQNSYNIIYSYVDSQYIVQAMAIKNSIGGICGFLVSLLAGKILDVIQRNGNRVFGVPIYGQQVLAMISVLLVGITIIYIHRVIEKQVIRKQ